MAAPGPPVGPGEPAGAGAPDILRVKRATEADRAWMAERAPLLWGAPIVVARGQVHRPAELPCFVAWRASERVGVATYEVRGKRCELVTIDAFVRRSGVGTALVGAVCCAAVAAGCVDVWLITTNDNVDALRFYQRRGFVLVALHVDALTESRWLKPSIPLVGEHGIPLRDELELRRALDIPR